MSLWESPKPVIAQVHGWCVGGGTDMALCSDLIYMAEDAQIGYPPARVWGEPTTLMWVYRLGLEHAKRLMLTGQSLTGVEAERVGLVSSAVPEGELEVTVTEAAKKMATIPLNQLVMSKLLVNQAYENMGLRSSQTLGTILDGVARHTPEGIEWRDIGDEGGVSGGGAQARRAVAGDYGEEENVRGTKAWAVSLHRTREGGVAGGDRAHATGSGEALVRPLAVARCDLDAAMMMGLAPSQGPFRSVTSSSARWCR